MQLPATSVYACAPVHGKAETAFQLLQRGGGKFSQFVYADGTRFVVDAETRRIWGECPPPLVQEDLVTYLIGPVLGFVLRRRGVLALHASSFATNGLAFVLCGGQGAGKSTTAAALALRGRSVHSEDITALQERDGLFLTHPGYPRVNLWPDAAANLFRTSQELPKITPNWEKRFFSLAGGTSKFENRQQRLAAVYLLQPRVNDDAAPRIEELSMREAALLLVQHTYMNYLLSKEQRALEFDAITRLASSSVVRRVLPSGDPAKLTLMCQLLENDSAAIASKMAQEPARRMG
jgi:hypothetical protein